jgi:hypothetical protein
MSLAVEIFSEQDWSKFHKDLLIKGLSDDKIESYCDYMLTEFNSGLNEHFYQSEIDPLENLGMNAPAKLVNEYEELVSFFFFQYHTKGYASLNILALSNEQVQKWLHDILSDVNGCRELGKYELYELGETMSILSDILLSEDTGEYLQEKTATEEELKMIDKLQSIYYEKAEAMEAEQLRLAGLGLKVADANLALQQVFDEYLLEYQQASHDLNDAVEQMHKRINYVDVEGEIIEPASSILKEYALNAKIAFDIESVQTSILKINHWLNNNDTEKYQGKKSFLSWVNGAENKN